MAKLNVKTNTGKIKIVKNDVDTNIMTYTLETEESSTPAWISALKKTQNNRKEN